MATRSHYGCAVLFSQQRKRDIRHIHAPLIVESQRDNALHVPERGSNASKP
jgi:hypothetical protein